MAWEVYQLRLSYDANQTLRQHIAKQFGMSETDSTDVFVRTCSDKPVNNVTPEDVASAIEAYIAANPE
jgi:hypothetical protein